MVRETLSAITRAAASTDASSRQARINHRGCSRALNRIFNAVFINCLSLAFLLFQVRSPPYSRVDPLIRDRVVTHSSLLLISNRRSENPTNYLQWRPNGALLGDGVCLADGVKLEWRLVKA